MTIRVPIAGAGIGGVTTAIALHRFGSKTEVERAERGSQRMWAPGLAIAASLRASRLRARS